MSAGTRLRHSRPAGGPTRLEVFTVGSVPPTLGAVETPSHDGDDCLDHPHDQWNEEAFELRRQESAVKISLTDREGASERVEVRELEGGLFELLETPLLMCERACLGDIVRLALVPEGTYFLEDVVERPFRHFFRMIPGEYGHSRAIYDFGDWIVAHGGEWEALMGGLLFLHFPRGMRMPRVKAELSRRLESFAQSDECRELLKRGPVRAGEQVGGGAITIRAREKRGRPRDDAGLDPGPSSMD